MMPLFYILLALVAAYAILLLWLAYGFIRTPVQLTSAEGPPLPVSIIICARNEEKTIGRCLKAIVDQTYDLSKIQIIVMDDASADSTVLQARAILKNSGVNHKIISNQAHKGKKQSISFAMQFVLHELVILRDADTYTKSNLWLKSIAHFYAVKRSDLIIGPVAISDNSGLLWAIQAIENNVLTVLNAGSAWFKKPFLCNGANLIFTRSIFNKAGGYQKHLHIASGDDVLLLEDVKKIPGARIDFLKDPNAIVSTYPVFTLRQLLLQKMRWASKFKVNPNLLNSALALLAFIVNLAWLFCLFYGFLMPQNGNLSLIFVVFKLFIDFLLLFLAAGFIKNRALGWYILPIGLVYPVYSCIVALASVFMKPKWK